jgi:hypothetical protein
MKTTLIVILDEADHAEAKKLIEKLMGSSEPEDRARMVATYGADTSGASRLHNGSAWAFAC